MTGENLYKTETELIIEVVVLLNLEGQQWKSCQKADISSPAVLKKFIAVSEAVLSLYRNNLMVN